MSSSVNTAALILLLSSPCMAQAGRPGVAVPPRLADAVAGAVATQLAADSSAIQLEWGAIPSAASLSDSTPFSLSGKGTEGWLVALFTPVGKSPLAVRVRAGVLDSVPVAARPITRGTTLAPADIRREQRVRWGASSAAISPEAGWVTRRAFAAGDVITPSSVTAPQVVQSGDQVRVEWQHGAVTVALDGVALASGGMGETVSVRLAQRGGQRRGRVTGPGSVRLES